MNNITLDVTHVNLYQFLAILKNRDLLTTMSKEYPTYVDFGNRFFVFDRKTSVDSVLETLWESL